MSACLHVAVVRVRASCGPGETHIGGGGSGRLGRDPAAEAVDNKYGTKPGAFFVADRLGGRLAAKLSVSPTTIVGLIRIARGDDLHISLTEK